MLQNRKVGWEHCAILRTEDLLHRLVGEASGASAKTLGTAVERWVQDTLRESVAQGSAAIDDSAPSSLFEVPAPPMPVPGYVQPEALMKLSTVNTKLASDDSPGTAAAVLKPSTDKKNGKNKAAAKNRGMTVAQLKDDLKRRGLSRTGKKAELEARLEAAIKVRKLAHI
jgi:hypothetical protein